MANFAIEVLSNQSGVGVKLINSVYDMSIRTRVYCFAFILRKSEPSITEVRSTNANVRKTILLINLLRIFVLHECSMLLVIGCFFLR